MGDDFYTGPREDGGWGGVEEGGKVYFLSLSLRMPGEVLAAPEVPYCFDIDNRCTFLPSERPVGLLVLFWKARAQLHQQSGGE